MKKTYINGRAYYVAKQEDGSYIRQALEVYADDILQIKFTVSCRIKHRENVYQSFKKMDLRDRCTQGEINNIILLLIEKMRYRVIDRSDNKFGGYEYSLYDEKDNTYIGGIEFVLENEVCERSGKLK